MTTLTISNKEMEEIMKIVKSLEGLGLLIEGISKTIKRTKRQVSANVNRYCYFI